MPPEYLKPLLTPSTHLREQTQFALEFIKRAFEGEVCSRILRFAHAIEHASAGAGLARGGLRWLWRRMGWFVL